MARIDVLARSGKRRADPAFWLLIGQLIMFTGRRRRVSDRTAVRRSPRRQLGCGGDLHRRSAGRQHARPGARRTASAIAGAASRSWSAPRLVYAFLSLFLFFNIGTLPVLTAIRILMGACAGAYVPALRAALTDLSAPEQRAQRFSQLQAYEMVGLLVGPLIGGAAALWRDSAVFGITGLSMFIGLGVDASRPRDPCPAQQHGGQKGALPLVAHPRHRGADRGALRGRHHLVDVRRGLAAVPRCTRLRTRSSSGSR